MSTQPAGDIRVGPRVILAIVTRAIGTVEGCVGLAPGSQALVMRATEAGLEIEIEAILAYGAPIEPTARMLSTRIRTALEQTIGQPIAAVRVYVQGMRQL